MTVHAEQHANEIVVDGRGHIYLNGADFNFTAERRRARLYQAGHARRPGAPGRR